MITEKQIKTMRHSIGLNSHNKKPYRNYYNTGSQRPDGLENLVSIGFATLRQTDKQSGGNYYHLTDAGLEYILKNPEQFGLDKRIKKLETLDEKCNL